MGTWDAVALPQHRSSQQASSNRACKCANLGSEKMNEGYSVPAATAHLPHGYHAGCHKAPDKVLL